MHLNHYGKAIFCVVNVDTFVKKLFGAGVY